jgi:DNA-binding PadR family transcriptional regulator
MVRLPSRAVERALPLRPRDLLVLLVLAGGDLHGYGIMKEIERESGGQVTIEVGSLYRTLARLLRADLISEVEEGAPAAGEDEEAALRRRYYRLSAHGRQVAHAEAERLRGVLRLAAAKGLLAPARDLP